MSETLNDTKELPLVLKVEELMPILSVGRNIAFYYLLYFPLLRMSTFARLTIIIMLGIVEHRR